MMRRENSIPGLLDAPPLLIAAGLFICLLTSGCGATASAKASPTPTERPIVVSSTSTVPTPTAVTGPADAVPTALTPFVPSATAPAAQTSRQPAAGTGTPATTSSDITIGDFAFTPANLTVSTGTKVTWTNIGPSNHLVAANDGSFTSSSLAQNATFSFTFNKPGTYAYHCAIHPTMVGTIIVK